MRPLNIVLVGEESAGIQTLKLVCGKQHTITAVVTSRSDTVNRAACLHDVAKNLGCRLLPAKVVKDPAFAEFIRVEDVDLLLNVHSLHIIHPAVLAAPHIGAFNLHPGPLPHYAGLNVVSWAIYRGETQHGVTIHKMEHVVDTGAIAYQEMFDLNEDDSGLRVSTTCTRVGLRLIDSLLDAAGHGCVPARKQDLTRREFFGSKVPHNGVLDWNWPARRIRDFIRACDFAPFSSPWGVPVGYIGEYPFNVLKAKLTGERSAATPGTVRSVGDGHSLVACSDEWLAVDFSPRITRADGVVG